MTKLDWTILIMKFEKATGTTVSGFNPSISGYDKGDMNAGFQIPLWLAERIVAAKKTKKKSK